MSYVANSGCAAAEYTEFASVWTLRSIIKMPSMTLGRLICAIAALASTCICMQCASPLSDDPRHSGQAAAAQPAQAETAKLTIIDHPSIVMTDDFAPLEEPPPSAGLADASKDLAAASTPALEIISRRVILRSSFPRSHSIPMLPPVQAILAARTGDIIQSS